jgi:hypothetical protein
MQFLGNHNYPSYYVHLFYHSAVCHDAFSPGMLSTAWIILGLTFSNFSML